MGGGVGRGVTYTKYEPSPTADVSRERSERGRQEREVPYYPLRSLALVEGYSLSDFRSLKFNVGSRLLPDRVVTRATPPFEPPTTVLSS